MDVAEISGIVVCSVNIFIFFQFLFAYKKKLLYLCGMEKLRILDSANTVSYRQMGLTAAKRLPKLKT